jgi:hypothetical protein
VARRNRVGINNVTYTVYKEWSDHALMNEIKENNYDVNVLWKVNIVCLWLLKNNFVLMIVETPILVDHEINCIEKLISLTFRTYEEHPNRRLYASCVTI